MVKKLSRKKKMLISFFIVAGVLLTIFLFAREDLNKIATTLKEANRLFIVSIFCFYLFNISIWAMRWKVALSIAGFRAQLRSLYLIIFGSIFINNVTPFTYVGGDPIARAFLLKKVQRVPYSSGSAVALGEFILDLPVFFSIILFGLLLSSFYLPVTFAVFGLALAWSLVPPSIFVLSRFLRSKSAADSISRFLARVLRLFRKPVNKVKITRDVKKFCIKLVAIISKKTVLFLLFCTMIIWIFGILRWYIIFLSLNFPNPSFSMLLFAVTLPAISGLIPFLPAGLGTVDLTLAGVFLLFGVPSQIAFSAILIERVVSLVFGTLVGACSLTYLGVKLSIRVR